MTALNWPPFKETRMKSSEILGAWTGLLAAFAPVGLSSSAMDVRGSHDHPLVARFPGAVIHYYAEKNFDAFTLPLGPAVFETKSFTRQATVEGRVTRILYRVPNLFSTLEVYRFYQSEFQQAGFTTLFRCEQQQCGNGSWESVVAAPRVERDTGDYNNYGQHRYAAVKMSRAGSDIHVALFVDQNDCCTQYHGEVFASISIVEGKPTDVLRGFANPEYPGSRQLRRYESEHESYALPTGRALSPTEFTKHLSLEGRLTRTVYEIPRGPSTLEIYRHLEKDLRAQGFSTLFSCAGPDCGEGFRQRAFALTRQSPIVVPFDRPNDATRVLAAAREVPGKSVYTLITVIDPRDGNFDTGTRLVAIEMLEP
jgi:hypothetical protein